MSAFFAFGNVTGKNQPVCGFFSDAKMGRIDFRVESLSGTAVSVAVTESNFGGSNEDQIGPVQTLNPGSTITIPINSAKNLLTLVSGSGNTGSAFVRVDALYLGTYGRGTLSVAEMIPGLTPGIGGGFNIPGGTMPLQ